MRAAQTILLLLLFSSIAAAFSIDDYQNQVRVNIDGSISVYEKITFDLDQQYNEGFRSIRKEDFSRLTDISIKGVKVNSQDVPFGLQMNGDKAEIVWKKTYVGTNVVELEYKITNQVQLFNDFARLCYEHFGANWQVVASNFTAKTTLPSGAANKTMHFEVYSTKNSSARIENLTIVIENTDLPPGNYVGGCYLFERSSVRTTNTVDGSAYEILKSEREMFGSQVVLAPEQPYAEWFCLPMFILSAVLAFSLKLRERRRPRLPETILPPRGEEPAVVTALVRNRYEIKELVAATILDLINRNVIDIVELEKAGEKTEEMRKERTILMLKKKPAGLKEHEKAVIEFIFGDKKEVDLDAEMEGYGRIKSTKDAEEQSIVKRVEQFNNKYPGQIKELFQDEEIEELSNSAPFRKGTVIISYLVVSVILIFFIIGSLSGGRLGWYFQHGEYLRLLIIAISAMGFSICSLYSSLRHISPKVPQFPENLEIYGKWDAFYRGLKSSRIKEYPPASAVIWGKVLVYATALGMADKVKRHLSELSVLDPKIAARMDRMDRVSIVTMNYYTSTISLSNLATFGSRVGKASSGGSGSYGGFSSFSSGGWSSGGGGGFSSGSSGGGGFR